MKSITYLISSNTVETRMCFFFFVAKQTNSKRKSSTPCWTARPSWLGPRRSRNSAWQSSMIIRTTRTTIWSSTKSWVATTDCLQCTTEMVHTTGRFPCQLGTFFTGNILEFFKNTSIAVNHHFYFTVHQLMFKRSPEIIVFAKINKYSVLIHYIYLPPPFRWVKSILYFLNIVLFFGVPGQRSDYWFVNLIFWT